jgi:hypothetical protein
MVIRRTKQYCFSLLLFILLSANCLISPDKKKEPPPAPPDTTAPKLILEKSADTVYTGNEWVPPGYSCFDSVDGDLTDSVLVTGEVFTSIEGDYVQVYSATDKKGNKSIEKCTITVKASPGLWAQYQLNGNGDDASGSGHSAKIVGSVTATSDRFNKAGAASQFDGTDNSYMVCDNLKGFPSGNCPKTLSGWVKTTTKNFQAFFGIGTTAAKGNFQIASDTGIRINGWTEACDWKTRVSKGGYSNEKWHHLAVTYDSVKTIFYLDGVQKSETSTYKYITDTTKGKVVIGNEIDFAGWPVSGAIDDVRIYARALSALQIRAICLSGGWSPGTDSIVPPDTSTPPDTTTPPDTMKPPSKVTGLTYQIKGAAGSLSLVLTWNDVPTAFSFGVYYDIGKTVDNNGYYRVALLNSYTLTGVLTEGEEYTFAVCATSRDGIESGLSDPITVLFKAP